MRNIAQRTKEILISELRFFFQNVSSFGFLDSPIKMPIIREAYALTIRQYPIIIIKILHEETKNLGIGRDFAEDILSDDQLVNQKNLPGTDTWKNPVPYRRRAVGERHGYMADITFNLQVWGDNTSTRNRTVDEINNALRFYQRESLLSYGIQFMRLSMGEETDYPLNESQKIYIANLNFVVNAEMYFDTPCDSITRVNAYEMLKPRNPSPHQPPYIIPEGSNIPIIPIDNDLR